MPACLPFFHSPTCSSAAQHGSDAASKMSAKLDPAKRYATSSTTKQAPQSLPKQPLNLPKTPSPIDLPAIAAVHGPWIPKQGKAL
jgi:hypothetical protein